MHVSNDITVVVFIYGIVLVLYCQIQGDLSLYYNRSGHFPREDSGENCFRKYLCREMGIITSLTVSRSPSFTHKLPNYLIYLSDIQNSRTYDELRHVLP